MCAQSIHPNFSILIPFLLRQERSGEEEEMNKCVNQSDFFEQTFRSDFEHFRVIFESRKRDNDGYGTREYRRQYSLYQGPGRLVKIVSLDHSKILPSRKSYKTNCGLIFLFVFQGHLGTRFVVSMVFFVVRGFEPIYHES